MMSMKLRLDESNNETLVVDKELVDMKLHLALNKIMVSVRRDPLGKKLGFFKLMNGKLQIHICIPKDNGKKEWHRFHVLNAEEEELTRNKRFNIIEDEKV